MTCESKPNHHYVIKGSVNRVFEKELEVLRSQECHNHLRIDLLYLLHLSDLKKVHYAWSYGHFIEKVQHNNNNNNNNNNPGLVARGGLKSSIPAITHDTFRDGRKGDPQHKCFGK